jgi:hypothetical protein
MYVILPYKSKCFLGLFLAIIFMTKNENRPQTVPRPKMMLQLANNINKLRAILRVSSPPFGTIVVDLNIDYILC